MHDLLSPLAVARQPFTVADAATLGVDRHVPVGLARAGTLARSTGARTC
ncbi:MAG TPA: hypothetical protein VK923_11780 [Euzebyales bacterium]|nr:hypothetical protein [Euzebyales bacterium]